MRNVGYDQPIDHLSGGADHAIRSHEVMPESLQTLIEQHIEQLSLDDQTLLEAASVAGVEFTAAAVAAGLAQADEMVEVRCTVLAQQGRFLQPSGCAEWPNGMVTACYRFRRYSRRAAK